MSTYICIANNAAQLEAQRPDYTVEAEFGDEVVEGLRYTLAHHGPRAANPCPCLEDNHTSHVPGIIGISHVDLDTLGGILAILGIKPEDPDFWAAAAQVDIRGVHHLSEITTDERVVEALNAYWAFSETHRVFAPRDGRVLDVTAEINEHAEALAAILGGDEALTGAGRWWAATKEELAKDSFVEVVGGVVLRKSESFVNHLYDGNQAVVAYNTTSMAITVSLADPIPGISCRALVQKLWGPEAGGHDGIAGSPRGREMAWSQAVEAVRVLADALYAAK
jgi:hypothetical protein